MEPTRVPSHRILIVDDSATLRFFAAAVLRQAGYDVDIHDNAFIGQRVDDWKPHLVLMDVKLGNGLGTDAVKAVRDRVRGSGVRFVLYSSIEPAELARLAEECLADGYVHKDGSVETLLSTVQRHLAA